MIIEMVAFTMQTSKNSHRRSYLCMTCAYTRQNASKIMKSMKRNHHCFNHFASIFSSSREPDSSTKICHSPFGTWFKSQLIDRPSIHPSTNAFAVGSLRLRAIVCECVDCVPTLCRANACAEQGRLSTDENKRCIRCVVSLSHCRCSIMSLHCIDCERIDWLIVFVRPAFTC